MGSFDFNKAAGVISSSPEPILDTLGTQFGVPQCALDFSRDFLSLLPTNLVTGIGTSIQEGREAAVNIINNIMQSIYLDLGIIQYDAGSGRFIFVSDSSVKGVENAGNVFLDGLDFVGQALGFGSQVVAIGENIEAQVQDFKNCLQQFTTYKALQKGPSGDAHKYVGFEANGVSVTPPPAPTEAANELWDANQSTLQIATDFVQKCDDQIRNINGLLQDRQKDPTRFPEPCYWGNYKIDDNTILSDLAGPFSEVCLVNASAGPNGQPIVDASADPFNPFVDVINASGLLPPVSKKGQFLFSKTGMYYDAYGGGLDYSGCISNIVNLMYYDEDGNPRMGTGVPPKALEWIHEYNPNLGGKGEQVTWSTFNKWANTAFDIEQINESSEMQEFYDADHFLQVLIEQRNKEVYDLSGYLQDLTSSGYSEDSIVYANQRQTIYSKIAAHDTKIKKRKKQIEVHVYLSSSESPAVVGSIPVNDFGSLDAGLIAIEQAKQEYLLFNPGDVSGVVLPLCPTFVKSEVPQDAFTANELQIAPIGVGSILNSDPIVSGTSGTVLSLTDSISVDKLVSVYNFMNADIVAPNSDKYLSINCNGTSSDDKPAQLIASSIGSMFPSGISIPYFRGICNFFSGVDGDGNSKSPFYSSNEEYLRSAYTPYGYGRIQSGFNEVDSLLYNNKGASFDFWVHVPDLGNENDPGWNSDSDASSLHRVILGCENRGGSLSASNDQWNMGLSQGGESIRGALMGFSRDRRITQALDPSNDPADNSISDGLVFHLSPTQSINTSGVTFITTSGIPGDCLDSIANVEGYLGLAVDTSSTTQSGYSFNDCSTAFVHAAVSIDYPTDTVSVYLNGELLTTSSVTSTFGTKGPPNIPSMSDLSSFSYDIQYENDLPLNAPLFPPNSLGYRDFWHWEGPQTSLAGPLTEVTPWIIGGGYTDGMHAKDLDGYTSGDTTGMNFMGGKWGGRKSGLYGFLGSLKLYTKAITQEEVLKNYNAQKGFFTNIETYSY